MANKMVQRRTVGWASLTMRWRQEGSNTSGVAPCSATVRRPLYQSKGSIASYNERHKGVATPKQMWQNFKPMVVPTSKKSRAVHMPAVVGPLGLVEPQYLV